MEKNNKITTLKFIAIILVVFGHSIIIYDNNWNIYSTNLEVPILKFIKQSINIIQMPLWFSLSGFLFFYSKKTEYKIFFKKKFYRLIVPFFMISIVWLIPIRYLLGYNSYVNSSFTYVFINCILFGKDVGHLWYLPTLFAIFMLMNLYKIINNKNKINKYLDIVILIILTIISFLGAKLPSYLGYIATYMVYFYIGILLNKYRLDKNHSYGIMFLILYLAIQSIFVYFIKERHLYLIMKQVLAYIFLFTIYKICTERIDNNKVIKEISYHSYGIYLLHSPLVYITFSKIPNLNPLIMVFINFVIFGTISYVLSKAISKSKIKFIIGQ